MQAETKEFLRKRWYWPLLGGLFLAVAYLNKLEDTQNAEQPHKGDIFFFKGESDKHDMPYQVAYFTSDSIYFYASTFITFDVKHVRDYKFDDTQFNHKQLIGLSRKQLEAYNKEHIISIPVVTKLRKG